MKLRKHGDELQKLRTDFDQLREELDNDDSGVGELLTMTHWDDNPTDLENRQTALAEAINEISTELEQLSVKMDALDRTKSNINEHHVEFREKFDQLSAEIQQEIDTDN